MNLSSQSIKKMIAFSLQSMQNTCQADDDTANTRNTDGLALENLTAGRHDERQHHKCKLTGGVADNGFVAL